MKIFREIKTFNPEEPFTMYHNEEIWFPLEYQNLMPNMYEISNFGRVRSIVDQHYPELYINKDGYYDIRLRNNNGQIRTYRHHRLVATVFCVKPCIEYNVINHIDSNRTNNDFRNLEWCTQQMNIRHAYEKNRLHAKPGEKHFNSKYSDDFIHSICNLMNQGYSNNQIIDILGLEKTRSIEKLFGKIRQKKTHVDISNMYPNITTVQKFKTFDDDTIRKICEAFQQYPNMRYKEIIELLGLEPGKNTEKVLSRIKTRVGYTEISKYYNW